MGTSSQKLDDFHKSVFINCPFDEAYKPLMGVLIFTIKSCGLEVRIALERFDSSEGRFEKIKELILASN